DVLLAESF
ncbi:hypothetical protein D030_3694B, partial [Vibrio parahaemolyticus AQ3810]